MYRDRKEKEKQPGTRLDRTDSETKYPYPFWPSLRMENGAAPAAFFLPSTRREKQAARLLLLAVTLLLLVSLVLGFDLPAARLGLA